MFRLSNHIQMEANPREYCLNDIIAAKHYPQVLRVTRACFVHDREYFKAGQYITLLDRRRVELLTGSDQEARPFKVRKDRSNNVEVVEDDRIVYNLLEVAEVSNHIIGIEIGREMRLEKQTFSVGEKFSIEKIGKSFRGRMKNIMLRREKDSKLYRLPLDSIGVFKLIAGKTKLPVSKLLSLRTLPLRAQFRNTPTSSNFPSGVVTIRDSIICDIIYILTIQSETYTYEAFSPDMDIYVEKCNVALPKSISQLIRPGMYVNSAEFVPPIKTVYRHRMAELDMKLIEDIYARGYYGSATYEKSACVDDHLVMRTRSKTSLSLDESYMNAMKTLSDVSSTPSTPDSEQSGPPVLPRHSKNKRSQKTLSFPAIHEFDWTQKANTSFSDSGTVTRYCTNTPPVRVSRLSSGSVIEFETESVTIEIPSNGLANRSISTNSMTSAGLEAQRQLEGQSIKVYCRQVPYGDSDSIGGRLVSRYYESPHGTAVRLHSRSSSITTEDSVDSGVVLTFGPSRAQSSPMDDIPPYGFPASTNQQQQQCTNNNPNNNLRLITMPALTTPISQTYQQQQQQQQQQHSQSGLPAAAAAATATSTTSTITTFHHSTTSGGGEVVRKVVEDINNNNATGNDKNNNIKTSSFSNNTHNNFSTSAPVTVFYPSQTSTPNADVSYRTFDNNPEQIPRSNSMSSSKSGKNNVKNLAQERVNEIGDLSQGDTGLLLKCLNLSRYIQTFQKELINGNLLLDLDEKTLRRDLGMTTFDARKLYKYVHGWRPIMSYADGSVMDANPARWSVSEVVEQLQHIKLQTFSKFCKDNHVDGSLLIDIVQTTIINTLVCEHNIPLSGIELSRLRAFTLKRWRPDTGNPSEVSKPKGNNMLMKQGGYFYAASQDSLNSSTEDVNNKRTKSIGNRIMASYS